jgi:acyl carrier protein
VETPADVERTLREALAALFPRRDLSGIGLDTDLVDALDLDSMTVIDFALEVERRLDLHVPDEDLATLTTLRGAVDYVGAHRGRPAG